MKMTLESCGESYEAVRNFRRNVYTEKYMSNPSRYIYNRCSLFVCYCYYYSYRMQMGY